MTSLIKSSLHTLIQKTIPHQGTVLADDGSDLLLKNICNFLNQSVKPESDISPMKALINVYRNRGEMPTEVAEELEKTAKTFFDTVAPLDRNDQNETYALVKDTAKNLPTLVSEKNIDASGWEIKARTLTKVTIALVRSVEINIEQYETHISSCEGFLKEIELLMGRNCAAWDIGCSLLYNIAALHWKASQTCQYLCQNKGDVELLKKSHRLMCKAVDTKRILNQKIQEKEGAVPESLLSCYVANLDQEWMFLQFLEGRLKKYGEEIKESPLNEVDCKKRYNLFSFAKLVKQGNFEEAFRYAANGQPKDIKTIFNIYSDIVVAIREHFLGTPLSNPEINAFISFFQQFHADLKKLDSNNLDLFLSEYRIQHIEHHTLFDWVIDTMLVAADSLKERPAACENGRVSATQKVILRNLLIRRREILNVLLNILIQYFAVGKRNLNPNLPESILLRIQHYCNANRIKTIIFVKGAAPLPEANEKTMAFRLSEKAVHIYFYIENQWSDPIQIDPKKVLYEFEGTEPITMQRVAETEEIFAAILRNCLEKRTSICGLVDAVLNEMGELDKAIGVSPKTTFLPSQEDILAADAKMAELIEEYERQEKAEKEIQEKKFKKKSIKWGKKYIEPVQEEKSSAPDSIPSKSERFFQDALRKFPGQINQAAELCNFAGEYAKKEENYELLGKIIHFMGSCATVEGLRKIQKRFYMDAFDSLNQAHFFFKQALQYFEEMVSKGYETSIQLETLSKRIQEDIEDILLEMASLNEIIRKKNEKTLHLLTRLEESAMQARINARPEQWFANKPFEMRSLLAQNRIRLGKEIEASFEIGNKTGQLVAELAPVAKCYRLLNNNKGRSPIDNLLPDPVKNSLLKIENLAEESFSARVQILGTTRFLSLTAETSLQSIED